MSDKVFQNAEGSTGRWEAGKGFVAFTSQADADKSLKPTTAEKAAAEPEADTDEKTAARTSTAKK